TRWPRKLTGYRWSRVCRMSLYCNMGGMEIDLSPEKLRESFLQSLAMLGEQKSVLAVPPDYSRVHSRAGDLTRFTWEYYGERLQAILPALGTHVAMPTDQIRKMVGRIPLNLFQVHNWRTDCEALGEVPAEFVRQQSEGKVNYSWPAQINRLVSRGGFDLILSIGQVVPHEVIGM